ncbi:MAG: CDP-alcohol phosphatidyltransferase family protein [Planctomycetes bacterium]|nr:CDP-alcohol phosphatidyltransferase family protein [Planctomycetota bacterium]
MTWPNKVTYSRILLIPVFIIAALQIREHIAFRYVTVAIFLCIAAGDALDGYIARRFNMSSIEGKFIDPLADKLIMITACVLLAMPLWALPGDRAPLRAEIATIIIARDVLICIYVLAAYLAGHRAAFEPTRLGRFTTFIQMVMIAVALVATFHVVILDWVAVPLSYVTGGVTIASGGQYLYRYTKQLRSTGNTSKIDKSEDS